MQVNAAGDFKDVSASFMIKCSIPVIAPRKPHDNVHDFLVSS